MSLYFNVIKMFYDQYIFEVIKIDSLLIWIKNNWLGSLALGVNHAKRKKTPMLNRMEGKNAWHFADNNK